jgi:hypothetical protein
MSQTRLPYDGCAYDFKLKTSQGVLEHVFEPLKFENCTQDCDQNNVEKVQNVQRITRRIDVENELLALPRNTSLCPTKKYLPEKTTAKPLGPTLNHYLCDRDIVNFYHLPRNYSAGIEEEPAFCPLK